MMMSRTIRKRKKDDKRAQWHEEHTAVDMGFAVSSSRSTAFALGPSPNRCSKLLFRGSASERMLLVLQL